MKLALFSFLLSLLPLSFNAASQSSQPSQSDTIQISNLDNYEHHDHSFEMDFGDMLERFDIVDHDQHNHPFDSHTDEHHYSQEPPIETDCDALFTNQQLCEFNFLEDSFIFNNSTIHYFIYNSTHSTELQTPLVVLSQVGYDHSYLLPIRQLACLSNRNIVFYWSSHASEMHAYSLDSGNDYWINELNALLNHLKFKQIVLLGHGFGAFIAQRFASIEKTRIRGLISVSGWSDSKLFKMEMEKRLEDEIAPLTYREFRRLAKGEHFDDEVSKYHTIVEKLISNYVVRTVPLPNCVVDSFETFNAEIFSAIYGENEFEVSGSVANLSINEQLKEIEVPVLISIGKYDLVTRRVAEDQLSHLTSAISKEIVEFKHSGSLSFVDDADEFSERIGRFLASIESVHSAKDEL